MGATYDGWLFLARERNVNEVSKALTGYNPANSLSTRDWELIRHLADAMTHDPIANQLEGAVEQWRPDEVLYVALCRGLETLKGLYLEEKCGARPYPAGSEGDDGTVCMLPKYHNGPHDDCVPIPSAMGAGRETSGLL
jgi:hypothetical protein